MSMITNNYRLDLAPGASVPPVIFVSQYDTKARTLHFELVGDGTISYPTGTKVSVRGTKPDGNGFDYLVSGTGGIGGTVSYTVGGSTCTVEFDLQEQMTAVAGRVTCELVLFTGTPPTTDTPVSDSYTQLATTNFILQVERAALDKDTISDSEIRQLIDVVDHTQELLDAAETIRTTAVLTVDQTLSAVQKQKARNNISAVSQYDFNTLSPVRYVAQEIAPSNQATARNNIGAASAADVTTLRTRMTTAEGDIDALEDALAHVAAPTDEQVAEAVSEWLDVHPEATTTVEDGAVTFEKLAHDLNRAQIVKNIAELKTSTADYVYVIENDSKVSDICKGKTGNTWNHPYDSDEPFSVNRGGCWYWKHGNSFGETSRMENSGGYLRENEDVMFAMPDQGARVSNSADALSCLFDVFASYYNSNSFVYGQQHTMFTPSCTPNENGKYDIDCSSLVSAVLQGIRMETSRYTLGSEAVNVHSVRSSIQLPSTRGTGCLYLDELVEYFAENKQLFTIRKEGTTPGNITQVNGIQPGDILFSCDPYATGSERGRWASYYAVDHVVLVLAVYPEDGALLICEGGGSGAAAFTYTALANDPDNQGHIDNDAYKAFRTVKIDEVNFYQYAGTKYRVFARPAYKAGRCANNISGYFRTWGEVQCGQVQHNYNLAYICPAVPMHTGTLYTLTVKGVLPRYEYEDAYLRVVIVYTDADGVSHNMPYDVSYMLQTDGRMAALPIVLPNDTAIDKVKAIMATAYTRETTGQTYSVDEMALYDGMSYGAEGSRVFAFTKDAGFTNSVTNYSNMNGHTLHIHLRFSATGTANAEVTVGKFDNWHNISDARVVVPASVGALNYASLIIEANGTVKYATGSTSTGMFVCNADVQPI